MDGVVGRVSIAGRLVGDNAPCFVIAEAGVNHNGSVDTACRLVDEARHAGADAVKFQTFSAERLVTACAPKAAYQRETTGTTGSQLEMLHALELSPEDHRVIHDHCADVGVMFLSTPFDEESADLLDRLGVPAFKIPSGEITNLPFLANVARRKRPLIVSTGMSSMTEVEAAVSTIRKAGNDEIVLLHCVSNYPADPADVNLRAMRTMGDACGLPVGYSDHTMGSAVAVAAVVLGACAIEKHLTLDRGLPGPDQRVSMEPDEFSSLVRGIREVEAALGDGLKRPSPAELDTARIVRKSLVAAGPIAAGTVLTEDLISTKRPGTGLSPALRPQVVGRTARVEIAGGTVITWEMLTA